MTSPQNTPQCIHTYYIESLLLLSLSLHNYIIESRKKTRNSGCFEEERDPPHQTQNTLEQEIVQRTSARYEEKMLWWLFPSYERTGKKRWFKHKIYSIHYYILHTHITTIDEEKEEENVKDDDDKKNLLHNGNKFGFFLPSVITTLWRSISWF